MTASTEASKSSARYSLYEEIRRQIISLELPPATALSENELAAALGVSRTPIREALLLLIQDGLVQVYPKVGSFVAKVDPAAVAEAQFLREAVEVASLRSLTFPLDERLAVSLSELVERQDATADLATLAVEHAHHYFRSQILAAENTDFGKHPRELFWPVEGGVEIHSVFIHPLFTSASALQRYVRRHFANIDYGMIPRMFTHAQTIKVIEDAREAYVNNFTAANRLYETTGRPFLAEDFMRSHDKYSYAVQRSLFTRTQKLPCRLDGWTGCRNVEEDVRQIDALLHANQVLPADNG